MYPSPAEKQGEKDVMLGVKIGLVFVAFALAMLFVSAVALEVSLSTETTKILSRVGKGIGDIQKERMLFDENGTNYLNETYIDRLELIKISSDTFLLYQINGINKEFRVELEKICTEYNETEEGTYCIIWREQTSQEVLVSAEAQAKKILNHIASVILKRERKTVQIIEVRYYSCASKSIIKAECPGGLSGGKHTRCYLIEAGKSPWDYCSEGWIEV